ncbi:MAG: cadherin-like beta sandwich domain-containing protein, partial [Butyrivibrio sp.]
MIVSIISIKPADKVYAASGSITITPGSKTVYTGDTFEVVVTLHCQTGVGYANFSVNYDPSILTYVSGDAAGSGYNGVIPFTWATGMSKETDITYKLNFKAVQTGNTSITGKANECVDVDLNPFTPGISNSAISVIAPGSDDATLSSLQVGGTALIPAFAKWTMDYTCYVNNAVTSVNISATSSQGGRVEISGTTENLQLGSNYVTVTSYAPNGKTMKYNINIYRLDPPTEPPTDPPTEPPTDPPEDIAIKIDGKSYNVSSSFDASIVPEGFNIDLGTYKGNDVVIAKDDKHNITLMYLVDEEGNGDFYIHDNGVFYHYCVITIEENIYFVFDSRKADNTPEGTEKEVTVRDKSVKG